MTTAQDVFNSTMALIDEVNESSGATDTNDTREYKQRTLYILNILRGELFPYSDTFRANDTADKNRRPISRIIENFTDEIDLDDYICQSVLPYGLAAHLLLDENPSSAGYFNDRYEQLKALLARGMGGVSEDIEDVYGGFVYTEFSRW